MNKILVRRPLLLRFPAQEQILFAKRLGMLLRGGMPIVQSLSMLRGEAHTASAAFILSHVTAEVERGAPLSHGLQKFRSLVGDFSIHMVRIGEMSGTLSDALSNLSEELKKSRALRKRVVGSLMYPALISVLTIGITLALTIYIFPKITPIFQSFKTDLPFMTRMLMGVSAFLAKEWLVLFASLVLGGFFLLFLLRLRRVRLFVEKILLHVPVVGQLLMYYHLSMMSRTLALLMKGGMGVVEALHTTAQATQYIFYRQTLEQMAGVVAKGKRISVASAAHKEVFPSLMTQMLSAGEESGNLTSAFFYIAEMYEEEVTDLTKNLTTMLEPALMIVMGIIVGCIALSIITPIYGITQHLTPNK